MDEAILIPIVLFVSIAWVIERTTNRIMLNRERIKLLEKGGDLKDLNINNIKNSITNENTLKYGLVAIGVSIGCLLGSFLEQNQTLANSTIGYFFSIFLFTGIALVLSHYLLNKQVK